MCTQQPLLLNSCCTRQAAAATAARRFLLAICNHPLGPLTCKVALSDSGTPTGGAGTSSPLMIARRASRLMGAGSDSSRRGTVPPCTAAFAVDMDIRTNSKRSGGLKQRIHMAMNRRKTSPKERKLDSGVISMLLLRQAWRNWSEWNGMRKTDYLICDAATTAIASANAYMATGNATGNARV